MTVGEKIKYYRELRRLNQQQLAQLSGVPLDSIKKYETGSRNPKLKPLEKIATALCVSVTAFHDTEVQTVGDVLPYFFTMAKLGEIQFHGSKNEHGTYDVNDLTFSFKSPVLKHFMKEWADKKAIIDHLRDEAEKSPDANAKEYLLHRANEIEQELELRVADSQIMI